MIWRSVELT
jgi:hypothetical protein